MSFIDGPNAVTIDGNVYVPWNPYGTDLLARLHAGEYDGHARELQVDAQCMMIGQVIQDSCVALVTTRERNSARVRRAFFAAHGVNLPVSLRKAYVPWWESWNGYPKHAR